MNDLTQGQRRELTAEQQCQIRVVEHARDKTLEALREMRRQLRAGTLDVTANAAAGNPTLQHAESVFVEALIEGSGGGSSSSNTT